jgi:hypothetical protein
LTDHSDHLVTCRVKLLHDELPVVPGTHPSGEELPHALDSLVRLALRPGAERGHVPNEFGVDDFLQQLPGVDEVLVATALDLEVVFGHR